MFLDERPPQCSSLVALASSSSNGLLYQRLAKAVFASANSAGDFLARLSDQNAPLCRLIEVTGICRL